MIGAVTPATEAVIGGEDRRRRLAVVAFLLFGTPIFAELLASYLSDTGDVFAGLGLIAFLAPLYGGAALLIREVSIRADLGWRGRVLLATAFGVAMPTLVDVSLFDPVNADVDNWDEIVGTTAIGDLGVSAYAVLTWVAGHVVMSVCAPLAVAEGLAAGERERSWMGRRSLATLAVVGVGIALLIHFDGATARASATETLVSAAVVLALLAAAFGPWARPLPPRVGSTGSRPLLLVGGLGFGLMLAFDLAPIDWLGVVVEACVLLLAWILVRRLARSSRWGWRQIAVLGYGAVLARGSVGFLVPVPADVTPAAKYAQNALLLAVVIVLGLVLRRAISRAGAERRYHGQASVMSTAGDSPREGVESPPGFRPG